MNRTKKHKKDAAARARQGRLRQGGVQPISPDIPTHVDSDSDFEGKHIYYVPNSDEECDWDGTVNRCSLSDSDFEWTDSESMLRQIGQKSENPIYPCIIMHYHA